MLAGDESMTEPAPISEKPRSRWGTITRYFLIALALVGIGLGVLVAYAWQLAGAEPQQRQLINKQIAALSREQRIRAAERVQAQFWNAFGGEVTHRAKDITDDAGQTRIIIETLPERAESFVTQQIEVSLADLNIWFSERYEAWLKNQAGSKSEQAIQAPRIWANEQSLYFSVYLPEQGRFGTIAFRPQFQEDGKLLIHIDRVMAGRLDLFEEMLGAQLADHNASDATTSKLLQAAFDKQPIEPVIEKQGGRGIHFTAIHFTPDSIRFEYYFEPGEN